MKEIFKLQMANKSISFLKEMAIKLAFDTREEAGTIFAACLDVLESKMEEKDFVAFCDENL